MTGPATAGPIPITRARARLVAGGGAAGALCRWGVAEGLPTHDLAGLPWALLVVNLVGSAVFAAAIVASRRRPDHASVLIDGVGTGFCGGLTTFSAFALTTAEQLRGGEAVWALVSMVVMLAVGISASAVTLLWLGRPGTQPAGGHP